MNIYDESIKIKLLIINKIKVFPIITSALSISFFPLAIEQSAWMNPEAWEKTLETGEAHYYSRSRKCLWHKGGTSGHVQKVKSIRLDCDGDAVVLLIEQIGGACHEGYRSCFSRELRDGKVSRCSELVFDPKEVYNG